MKAAVPRANHLLWFPDTGNERRQFGVGGG